MKAIITKLPVARPGTLVPPWAHVIVIQRRVITRQGRELDAALADNARLRAQLLERGRAA